MPIPTTGLICAWDLTSQTAGVQSIAGAHGTTATLQMGSSSGVDGDDPASVQTTGLNMNTGGADDYCQATSLADTDMRGDITIIVVGNINQGTSGITSKSDSETLNAPFHFRANLSRLDFSRANATGFRSYYGFTNHANNIQLLAVTAATAMETAPTFWVNKHKVTGTAIAGSGTGAPTTSANNLRIGTVQGYGGNIIAAYYLLYNRILTDAEIKGIYDSMETIITGLGDTVSGFGNHKMASSSSPAPFVVTASTGTGYLAFDSNINAGNYWIATNNGVDFLKLDIGSGNTRKLGSYKLVMHNQYAPGGEGPKDWTLEGSDDDTVWNVVDTVTNQTGWLSGETRTYSCDITTTPYRYFRINITANGNGTGNTTIGEWYLYEQIIPEVTSLPNIIGAIISGQSFTF